MPPPPSGLIKRSSRWPSTAAASASTATAYADDAAAAEAADERWAHCGLFSSANTCVTRGSLAGSLDEPLMPTLDMLSSRKAQKTCTIAIEGVNRTRARFSVKVATLRQLTPLKGAATSGCCHRFYLLSRPALGLTLDFRGLLFVGNRHC